MEERTCETCSRELTKRQAKYCSKSCRMKKKWEDKDFAKMARGNLRQFKKRKGRVNIW